MTRIIIGILFVLCSLPFGALIGAYVGTRYFVPGGSGLANPVVGLYYGAIGAAIMGVVAIILSIYLSRGWLLGLSIPVIVIGVVCGLIFLTLYLKFKEKSEASLQEAYDKLNQFEATLTYDDGDAAPPFRRMEVDWSKRQYSATTAGADPQTCTADLSGEDAVALLGALRGAEVVLAKNPSPCSGTTGAVERRIRWHIREAKPPDYEGDVALTAACAEQHPELAKPFDVAARILQSGDGPKQCD
jgi:hypothetical protein